MDLQLRFDTMTEILEIGAVAKADHESAFQQSPLLFIKKEHRSITKI